MTDSLLYKVLADKFGDSQECMTAVTDRHNAYFALHFFNHIGFLGKRQYVANFAS